MDEAAPQRRSAEQAAGRAMQVLHQMTGLPCESVSSLMWDDDAWIVTVEAVELARLPHTTDILASYAVRLDEDGQLLGYERRERYYRNQTTRD